MYELNDKFEYTIFETLQRGVIARFGTISLHRDVVINVLYDS